MNKKQLVYILLIAFVFGAIGSIFFDRVGIPYLSKLPGLSSLRNLQSDTPIVITRREEVRINDGVNLIELTNQSQGFTVSIYSEGTQNFELLGTGILMSSDGLIFTSEKVVGNLSEVNVVLNDGRSYPGLVRALDSSTELAVITIPVNNLPIAQLERASDLVVGQRVLALGKTTQEFTRKFASGFVTKTVSNTINTSQVFSSDDLSNTILADMPISNDFAGGPVLNLNGRVIGMVVDTGGKIVISESLDPALRSYLENQEIIRPRLGIKYTNFTSSLAGLNKMEFAGIKIVQVENSSPAKVSGLRVNDVVIELDGQSVEENGFELLFNRDLSDSVRFTILRDGEREEVVVNLGTK
jgi:serine protease DegQ